MDESNLNVFNQQEEEKADASYGERKDLQGLSQIHIDDGFGGAMENQMIGLQDLNLEGNLLDMSRISMGQPNPPNYVGTHHFQDQQADESVVHELFEEAMVKQSSDHSDLMKPPKAPGSVESRFKKIEEIANEGSNSNKEWKKVTIVKKKKFSSNKGTTLTRETPLMTNPTSKEQYSDLDIDLNQIQVDLVISPIPIPPLSRDNKSQPIILTKAVSKNKYASSEPEPLPLFECLYCVGLHEHLVLQTLKEKQLISVYGQNLQNAQLQVQKDNQSWEDFDKEFYQNVKHLSRLFVVELLEAQIFERHKDSQSSYSSSSEDSTSRASLPQPKAREQLRSILQGQISSTSYRPLESQVRARLARVVRSHVAAQEPQIKQKRFPVPKKEIIQAKPMSSNDSLDSQLVSNILDGFDDIDSEDQSMFINLNIRNRRQKILHNISFETEFYDIYNPLFSSDEESITHSSEQSSQSEEVEQFEDQGEKFSSQTSGSARESQTSSLEEEESMSCDDQGLKVDGNSRSELNEKDLDYNSENNHSSLSSIHREILEAPAEEGSSQMKVQSSIRSPKQLRNIQMESGGCQVEEMQNDTVVNKCNFLLTNKNQKEENESFSKIVAEQHRKNLTKQLQHLEFHPQMIGDSQPQESDLDDLASEENKGVQQVNSSGSKKRASGRYSSQFQINSNPGKVQNGAEKESKKKGQKRNSQLAKEKQNQMIFSTQPEVGHQLEDNDSVIKVIPILPGEPVKQKKTFAKLTRSRKRMESAPSEEEKESQSSMRNLILETCPGGGIGFEQEQAQDLKDIIELEEDEKLMLSPIARDKDEQVYIKMFGDLDSESGKLGMRKQLSKSKLNSPVRAQIPGGHAKHEKKFSSSAKKSSLAENRIVKGATQKINSRNFKGYTNPDLPQKQQKSANQVVLARKKTVEVPGDQLYSQMGRSQKKRNSNGSKNAQVRGPTGKWQTAALGGPGLSSANPLTSASMGALPTLQRALQQPSAHKMGDHVLARAESQAILAQEQMVGADTGKNKQHMVTKSKSKTKLGSIVVPDKDLAVTPVKARNTANPAQTIAAPNRASTVALNAKVANPPRQPKTEKQFSGKHTRHNAATLQEAGHMTKQGQTEALTKTGPSYGMLSKQQLKLMKQLERQQNNNPKTETANAKTVIDNYFKVQGEPMEQKRASNYVSQATTSSGNQGKNLLRNLQVLQQQVIKKNTEQESGQQKLRKLASPHYVEVEKKATGFNTRPSKKEIIDHNKYRSSLVEMQHVPSGTELISLKPKHSGLHRKSVEKMPRHYPTSSQVALQPVGSEAMAGALTYTPTKAIAVNLDLLSVKVSEQDYRYSKHMKFQSVSPIEENSRLSGIQLSYKDISTLETKGQGDQEQRHRGSLLHLSTSQLEKVNISDNETGLHPLYKKLVSKLTTNNIESNLFADENTNFSIPAQSHRASAGFQNHKLSISADKKPKMNELMKSRVELQQNFSQIQSREETIHDFPDGHKLSTSKVSKRSIERDIKLFKLSLQQQKSQTSSGADQGFQDNGQKLLRQVLQGKHSSQTSQPSNSGATNSKTNSMDMQRESLVVRNEHMATLPDDEQESIKLREHLKLNKRPVKSLNKPKLGLNNAVAGKGNKQNMGWSGPASTKHNRYITKPLEAEGGKDYDREVQEENQGLVKTQNLKAFDYKKLILENNQKILKYQSGLTGISKLTPKPAVPVLLTTQGSKQMLASRFVTNKGYTNSTSSQWFQTQEQKATKVQKEGRANFASVVTSGQTSLKDEKQSLETQLDKKTTTQKPSSQTLSKQQSQNHNEEFADDSGHLFSTSNNQIDQRTSLFAPNQIQGRKQGSTGGGQLLGTTMVGNGSIATGLGLTTFLKSNNANTTASSNTMAMGGNKSVNQTKAMHLSKISDLSQLRVPKGKMPKAGQYTGMKHSQILNIEENIDQEDFFAENESDE